MKGFVFSLLLLGVVVNAINLKHTTIHHKDVDADDVECEGFDTYALCPGGWPMIDADESKHRVKCCGAAGVKEGCNECNRCKVGSFADSCCTCDDDELVDAFWVALHAFHADTANKGGAVMGERELLDMIENVKGDMTREEELKIKDAWQEMMTHVLTSDQKTTSGLGYIAPISTYLRENPDIVDHLLGETESPSEGARQLALDHTKAVTPEWSSGLGGEYAGHLAPEIIRRTQDGKWEILVPNFKHPADGYFPAAYRHSHQEAVAYAAEKKAEYFKQEANQAMATHNARAKAAENVDLVNYDRTDGQAGYKNYNDQTANEQSDNLVGLVENHIDVAMVEKGDTGGDLQAAVDEVAAKVDSLEAEANAPGAVSKITTTHVESTDVRVERVVVLPGDELISMEAGASDRATEDGGADDEGSGSGSDGSGSDGSDGFNGSEVESDAAALMFGSGSDGSGSDGSGSDGSGSDSAAL